MQFKDIYNPKHVYEGFFETYYIRPFIHKYIDFRGNESFNSLLLSILAWLILTLGIVGIMLGQIGIIGIDGGLQALWIVCGIWLAFSLIPFFALLSRASHGAPKQPIKARMLGIDTLLGVSCLLFFILGLLMMTTTLNSGHLNPNARVYDESDSTDVTDMPRVEEEPIFTYQDETPSNTIAIDDSIPTVPEEGDIEENVEDNYDPTIDQYFEDVISDSI